MSVCKINPIKTTNRVKKMTHIEFKTKAVDIYNMDDSFSHKEVFLPEVFKSSHIKDAQSHRMFSGKVKPDMINIRAKMILKEMGIGNSFKLDQLPENVTVAGNYMLTVTIKL